MRKAALGLYSFYKKLKNTKDHTPEQQKSQSDREIELVKASFFSLHVFTLFAPCLQPFHILFFPLCSLSLSPLLISLRLHQQTWCIFLTQLRLCNARFQPDSVSWGCWCWLVMASPAWALFSMCCETTGQRQQRALQASQIVTLIIARALVLMATKRCGVEKFLASGRQFDPRRSGVPTPLDGETVVL